MSRSEDTLYDGGSLQIAFGEPISVLNTPIIDYLGTFLSPSGDYYLPPMSMVGLSKMTNANSTHGSCIKFRRNILANCYVNNEYFPIGQFRNAVTDAYVFGNVYLRKHFNYLGTETRLEHLPALNMRPCRDGSFILLQNFKNIKFSADEIIHLKDYDTQQQVFGMPDWLSGFQSALLNQDATLFRRKYFVNGCHLGYILYTSDASIGETTKKEISEAVKAGKGIGNFRSVHIHIPKGKEKSMQLIPVGDIGQKDEFEKIKNISSADVRVAHRVYPQFIGEKPDNTGGFGDIEKMLLVYVWTEVRAAAQMWMDINNQLPKKMQFKFNYEIPKLPQGTPAATTINKQ